MACAASLASRSVFAPVTSISITRMAPSPSRTIIQARLRQSRVQRALEVGEIRIGGVARAFRRRGRSTVSLVDVSPSTEMELKLPSTATFSIFCSVAASTCRVGHHEGEHRGHVRVDHARALGDADEPSALAVEGERRLRDFRADVGGEDGVRERVDAADGETADGVGEEVAHFLVRQHDADHAGRGEEHFFFRATQQLRGARAHAFRGVETFLAGDGIRAAGVDDDRLHASAAASSARPSTARPARPRNLFCVNTAAAVAPSSATMRPRSGRFLRMPARTPEAVNPLGSFNGVVSGCHRRASSRGTGA